jgi:hypothetical protein
VARAERVAAGPPLDDRAGAQQGLDRLEDGAALDGGQLGAPEQVVEVDAAVAGVAERVQDAVLDGASASRAARPAARGLGPAAPAPAPGAAAAAFLLARPAPAFPARRRARARWTGAADRYSTMTAAAMTVVQSPSLSPIADCVMLRVLTILSESRQMSLRSS